MKIKLRNMAWDDIVVYFLFELEIKKPKDLVDYFHFKYLTNYGINRWTQPNYITQNGSAKKLIDIYGIEYSIKLIDTLFDSYSSIFNKNFSEIHWSIGLLSSDKTGWIIERLIKTIEKKESTEKNDLLRKLLDKPRAQWTPEDVEEFQKMNSGV